MRTWTAAAAPLWTSYTPEWRGCLISGSKLDWGWSTGSTTWTWSGWGYKDWNSTKKVWVIVMIFTLELQVLLYPGALAGTVGQRFEAMVKRGGPLGELVQWADLSACLTILGHNLTFSTSQQHLHRLPLVTFHWHRNDSYYSSAQRWTIQNCDRSSLIGAPPGRGSCPIQRPLTFDLIYTDYHGLAHLHRAMGLAFLHYQYAPNICFWIYCKIVALEEL